MVFVETKLSGAILIEPERQEDERGFFARTLCQREFERNGLSSRFVQCSISYNKHKGTLRGLHYQIAPNQECKLVSCTRGAIYDVVLDLRLESPTYKQWVAVELTSDNRRMVYVPEGCAHGFQTLADDSEVFYQISEFYQPECSTGVRWNDPALAIPWPISNVIASKRDGALPSVEFSSRDPGLVIINEKRQIPQRSL